MKHASILLIALAAGCSSFGGSAPGSRQFDAPIARVRPAFVATLAQLGMPINAIENRGASEILKSRKSGQSVEIELERLSATATRVRVTGSGDAAGQVLRETEKRLAAN